MDSNAKAFVAGYKAVKNGLIDRELTPREIETYYHEYKQEAFTQGMIDGLLNDSFRYNLIIHQWQAQLAF